MSLLSWSGTLGLWHKNNPVSVVGEVSVVASSLQPRPERRPMKVSIEYRVPYADTDQMGVVYYANYLEYFERLRNALMRDAGLAYRDLEDSGYLLPVVEAHCRYHSPAHYDDVLNVCGWFTPGAKARLQIEYEITRKDEQICSGWTIHACLARSNFRPCRLPDRLMQVLE